ncbi:MAG TPA: aminotransferase class III-fold pyridoxal phosphate-dependent enzyme [Polyangiaceae bacterium]|jgi:glutamate-1-semialdehyde 2,1-aminomutase|nr:aminotransferase class III-fold pyridoxal phosphate-dependent enzyme [Polyangiaceae bacterium]
MIAKLKARLLLSRAKHPSLRGHAKMSQRVARHLPFYEYGEDVFFSSDGAPAQVAERRRAGFERLASAFAERSKVTLKQSAELEDGLPDVAFVNAHRVPFQYRNYAASRLKVGCLVAETSGPRVRDLDGNWAYDLGGAYGVNLFGHDFYKKSMQRGMQRALDLGMTLGSYHPIIEDNVRRLRAISGLDDVSFHMSGTEAVMQAVRLARYHTRRSHIVRFCGAYHGWWDGVQAGVGNPRPPREVYTLKEMDPITLRVLRTRDDIACVLVNPIQAMHPNGAPPADSMLVASDRTAKYDRAAYGRWLAELRDVCTERGIVLVIDDVFLGFRLAVGGTQEYFGVRADLVTYGKTLGGGLPVGVVCGRRDLMRRFREDRPADICFARGTFNSHPVVMATMNEFLRHLDDPAVKESYRHLDARWDGRARKLNAALESRNLPIRMANMTSVWTTLYLEPSRYNWMLQYYLRAQGLAMSWIGTGRFIFSHDLEDADFDAIADRIVSAAEAMRQDGFWWQSEGVTNRTIKRGVLRELVQAAARRGRADDAPVRTTRL